MFSRKPPLTSTNSASNLFAIPATSLRSNTPPPSSISTSLPSQLLPHLNISNGTSSLSYNNSPSSSPPLRVLTDRPGSALSQVNHNSNSNNSTRDRARVDPLLLSTVGTSTPIYSYNDFTHKMKHPAALELVKKLKNFVKSIQQRQWPNGDPTLVSTTNTITVEQARNHIQREIHTFMSAFAGLLKKHSLYIHSSPIEVSNAGESVEKFICSKLYSKLFGCFAQEREKDKDLSDKMKELNWISGKHLEVPDWCCDITLFTDAQLEFRRMELYKAPRDKMVCLLNACHIINNVMKAAKQQYDTEIREKYFAEQRALLAASSNSTTASLSTTSSLTPLSPLSPTTATTSMPTSTSGPSADDFFPVFLLVLIHSRPPHLYLHLQYISLTRHHERMRGESEYWWTMCMSACSFIESISPSRLKLEEGEWDRRIEEAKSKKKKGKKTKDSSRRNQHSQGEVDDREHEKMREFSAQEKRRNSDTLLMQSTLDQVISQLPNRSIKDDEEAEFSNSLSDSIRSHSLGSTPSILSNIDSNRLNNTLSRIESTKGGSSSNLSSASNNSIPSSPLTLPSSSSPPEVSSLLNSSPFIHPPQESTSSFLQPLQLSDPVHSNQSSSPSIQLQTCPTCMNPIQNINPSNLYNLSKSQTQDGIGNGNHSILQNSPNPLPANLTPSPGSMNRRLQTRLILPHLSFRYEYSSIDELRLTDMGKMLTEYKEMAKFIRLWQSQTGSPSVGLINQHNSSLSRDRVDDGEEEREYFSTTAPSVFNGDDEEGGIDSPLTPPALVRTGSLQSLLPSSGTASTLTSSSSSVSITANNRPPPLSQHMIDQRSHSFPTNQNLLPTSTSLSSTSSVPLTDAPFSSNSVSSGSNGSSSSSISTTNASAIGGTSSSSILRSFRLFR